MPPMAKPRVIQLKIASPSQAEASSCTGQCGVTNAMLPTHQQIQPERIRDGWYQLPGSTDYYGDDAKGWAKRAHHTGVGIIYVGSALFAGSLVKGSSSGGGARTPS